MLHHKAGESTCRSLFPSRNPIIEDSKEYGEQAAMAVLAITVYIYKNFLLFKLILRSSISLHVHEA